jgi:hypothetical protein
MPGTLGSVTRLVFVEEPEPGKIHLEFEAAAALKKGQQVKLNAAGKIVALGAGEFRHQCLGVLIQDVADTERATVAVRGYCVVIARAGAAIATGPVEIAAYDGTNNRPVYATITGASTEIQNSRTVGYNLDVLAAAGENKVILI